MYPLSLGLYSQFTLIGVWDFHSLKSPDSIRGVLTCGSSVKGTSRAWTAVYGVGYDVFTAKTVSVFGVTIVVEDLLKGKLGEEFESSLVEAGHCCVQELFITFPSDGREVSRWCGIFLEDSRFKTLSKPCKETDVYDVYRCFLDMASRVRACKLVSEFEVMSGEITFVDLTKCGGYVPMAGSIFLDMGTVSLELYGLSVNVIKDSLRMEAKVRGAHQVFGFMALKDTIEIAIDLQLWTCGVIAKKFLTENMWTIVSVWGNSFLGMTALPANQDIDFDSFWNRLRVNGMLTGIVIAVAYYDKAGGAFNGILASIAEDPTHVQTDSKATLGKQNFATKLEMQSYRAEVGMTWMYHVQVDHILVCFFSLDDSDLLFKVNPRGVKNFIDVVGQEVAMETMLNYVLGQIGFRTMGISIHKVVAEYNLNLMWSNLRVGRMDGASKFEACCELCIEPNAGKHAEIDENSTDTVPRIGIEGKRSCRYVIFMLIPKDLGSAYIGFKPGLLVAPD